MANRCYLFVSDKHPDDDPQGSNLSGLSEWRGSIPLSHQLLASGNCQLCQSRIWNSEHPLALVGDFQSGFERFLTFLNDLDVDYFEDAKQKAFDYFSSQDKTPRYVILEPTEIFHLGSDEPADACKALHASMIEPQKLEKPVFKRLREIHSRSLVPKYPMHKKELTITEKYEAELYYLGLTNWTNTLYFNFENN